MADNKERPKANLRRDREEGKRDTPSLLHRNRGLEKQRG